MHSIKDILRKFILIGSLLLFKVADAQSGTTILNFLNIPVSPKQAALGGDAVSVRDYDANFAMVNPALMNVAMDNVITANYASYLAGSKIGTINYVKDLEHGHFVSINARYMDYGSMPRTDEFGNQDGTFGAMDASIGGGYALQFEDDWEIGANINFVTSKIDTYTSSAIVGNLGVTYHREDRKETAAIVLRNFGYQLKTYDGTHEKMPFHVDFGYTRILESIPLSLTLTVHDLQQFNISQYYNNNGQKINNIRKITDHLSFGAELFPEDAFNIRLGYNVKKGNELAVLDQRNFSGLSAGFGIRISNFRFDYSHIRYHNSSNMNLFGITVDISGNRK